ncbi:MAG: TerB family tellurite resistance protein [Rhodospirillales bacterium]|nr:TerB family tellurite resistance protein [Rhodospirillales bacterium]
MIDRIKALILGSGPERDSGAVAGGDDLQVAAVALLVEAAVMDGDFDDAERDVIAALIADRFGLGDDATRDLISAGEEAVERSHQLYAFTRVIKQGFEVEDRIEMIEMLWDVACADGEIHDYEANLVRRVAGLIHVSDRDSGQARKRAMIRQNPER